MNGSIALERSIPPEKAFKAFDTPCKAVVERPSTHVLCHDSTARRSSGMGPRVNPSLLLSSSRDVPVKGNFLCQELGRGM